MKRLLLSCFLILAISGCNDAPAPEELPPQQLGWLVHAQHRETVRHGLGCSAGPTLELRLDLDDHLLGWVTRWSCDTAAWDDWWSLACESRYCQFDPNPATGPCRWFAVDMLVEAGASRTSPGWYEGRLVWRFDGGFSSDGSWSYCQHYFDAQVEPWLQQP